MASTLQAKKQITLKGSTQIVTEFFEYGLNSILFQRGLYQPEDFKMVKKYGLNLLMSCDDNVQEYIKQILAQVEKWLLARTITQLVLVISSKDSGQVLERWQFNVELEEETKENSVNSVPSTKPNNSSNSVKTEKEIHSEISAILRQITASVSFLPMLDEPCTFNILAYTKTSADVPVSWEDSDAKLITKNAEQVKLRSFSTSVHKVDALVAYRLGDD